MKVKKISWEEQVRLLNQSMSSEFAVQSFFNVLRCQKCRRVFSYSNAHRGHKFTTCPWCGGKIAVEIHLGKSLFRGVVKR